MNKLLDNLNYINPSDLKWFVSMLHDSIRDMIGDKTNPIDVISTMQSILSYDQKWVNHTNSMNQESILDLQEWVFVPRLKYSNKSSYVHNHHNLAEPGTNNAYHHIHDSVDNPQFDSTGDFFRWMKYSEGNRTVKYFAELCDIGSMISEKASRYWI